MLDSATIERSVRRRVKRGTAPVRGESLESVGLLWKDRHSGRVLDVGAEYHYSVNGTRKLSRYIADIDLDGDIVNGWSDKV